MDWNLNNPYWLIYPVFGLSLVSLWLYRQFADRLGLIDQADHRSSHRGTVVTGAGLVLLSIICISSLLVGIPLILVALAGALSLLGFVDDRVNLSSLLRLLVQALAVAGLLYFLQWPLQPWWLGLILAVLSLWWMNLFNFMDGANGMAGIHVLLCSIWYVFMFEVQPGAPGYDIEMLGIMMMLSSGAYLIFNFPNASLFMGDSGSLPFALLLAVLALTGIGLKTFSYWQIAVLHAAFIADASFTLLRRLLRKERFWQAHNSHVYQRIIQSGRPHWFATGAYGVMTALLGVLAWAMATLNSREQIGLMLLVYLILGIIFIKSQQLTRKMSPC